MVARPWHVKTVTTTMSKDKKERLEAQAKKENTTLQAIMTKAMDEYLERNKDGKEG